MLAQTYVRLSIDDFMKMLPEKMMIREQQNMAWQAEMLAELRRRELTRGDSRLGIGEKQLSALEPQDGYDVVADTFSHNATACADAIAQRLALADGFSAIKQMWQQAALSGMAEGAEPVLRQREEA